MTNATTVADLEDLQEIAGRYQRGPDSALAVFATTGAVPDRDRLADEITDAVASVEEDTLRYEDPAAYEQIAPEKLDELYELGTWVETHRYVYGFGHQLAGSPPGEPTFEEDPHEAVEAFKAMVQDFADTDDQEAADDLYWASDDYDCHCSHGPSAHHDGGGCEEDGCDCAGFQPDAGDDAPNMRATVDAILVDDPPRAGHHYAITVADSTEVLHTFWLQAIHIADDADAGAVGS
jgi:hypothetical protein